MRTTLKIAAVVLSCTSLLYAQKATIEGIRNFTRVDPTVACAGATEPAAMTALATLGYKAVINLREATEPGALVDESTAAAQAAGLKYIHLPLNGSKPDDAVVEKYLTAVKDPSNQPMFIHCASANRAGALWLIKRMLVDGWPEDRATSEAMTIGLSSPTLKQFALDYVAKHK